MHVMTMIMLKEKNVHTKISPTKKKKMMIMIDKNKIITKMPFIAYFVSDKKLGKMEIIN